MFDWTNWSTERKLQQAEKKKGWCWTAYKLRSGHISDDLDRNISTVIYQREGIGHQQFWIINEFQMCTLNFTSLDNEVIAFFSAINRLPIPNSADFFHSVLEAP